MTRRRRRRSRSEPRRCLTNSRSEKWVELYAKRVDETIAALKSKGVPVFWVGLPPIRGTRSMSEVAFLNDIYRSRAEKAGITYIDVWDGFVDEGNRFAQQGPDFEGQIRRLRTPDGVHFTQAGARKLAHYLDKEIRRAMTPTGPVAIPIPVDPAATQPHHRRGATPGAAMPRPLAGPVMPLNASAAKPATATNSRAPPARANRSTDAVADTRSGARRSRCRCLPAVPTISCGRAARRCRSAPIRWWRRRRCR